jgi:hypothetical protein
MAIIDDWREKHSSRSGKGRLIIYIFLLIMILFMILKADAFVNGFTSIFFSSDSTSRQEEGPLE